MKNFLSLLVLSLVIGSSGYAHTGKGSRDTMTCDADLGKNAKSCGVFIEQQASDSYDASAYRKLEKKLRARGYTVVHDGSLGDYTANVSIYGEEAPGYSDLHHEVNLSDRQDHQCKMIANAATDTGGRGALGGLKEIVLSPFALRRVLNMIPECPSFKK